MINTNFYLPIFYYVGNGNGDFGFDLSFFPFNNWMKRGFKRTAEVWYRPNEEY